MIKKQLEKAPLWVLAVYATLFIFLMYTCAYVFRKPFTAGIYEGETYWGFDAKILYVLAELIGYAMSKFIGVRILPGMKHSQRIYYAVGLMTVSEIALLGFAVLPVPLKIAAIFISGLPLGMIWGIVFSYIEGRRVSEVLNVGLSVALIVSSGIVKTLGQWVMDTLHVSEYWMPAVTGALCYPAMLLCAYLINQIPEPNTGDIQARTQRMPMNRKEQMDFLRTFFWGIAMLMLFYGSLTVFRELRDSFAADIWRELQVEGAFIFTQTEIPIACAVLILMFFIVFIKDNRVAINTIYTIAVTGCWVLIGSTWLYVQGYLSPIWWMVFSGLGMYMGYIPFTYLVERLIASLRVISTAVFLLYLADSFGYLGTTCVFLIKNFARWDIRWTEMLVYTAYTTGAVAMIAIFVMYHYFRHRMLRINREEAG